eukprot:1919974-Pyramimonas_sp.AAC.1
MLQRKCLEHAARPSEDHPRPHRLRSGDRRVGGQIGLEDAFLPLGPWAVGSTKMGGGHFGQEILRIEMACGRFRNHRAQ